MRAKTETGAIPPGFARPLTLGEVPLMACNDHNKPPDAPAARTYRMLLPSSESGARGYHALRFLRLRRVHLKQRWQKAATLLCAACVGFVLIFWSQLGVTMLGLVQTLRLRGGLSITSEDKLRCTGSLPAAYVRDALVSWESPERAEWLRVIWQSESAFAHRKLTYDTYMMTMAFVEAVTRSLAERNVQAALVGGSLVGSYLVHDFLPWGRVASFAVHADEKNNVKSILDKIDLSEAVGQNQAYSSADLQAVLSAAKAKVQVSQYAEGAKWSLRVKGTEATEKLKVPPVVMHIHWWATDNLMPADAADPSSDSRVVTLSGDAADGTREALRLPASEWEPFQKRPLGLLVLPAPQNPLFYITRRYQVTDPYCAARHFASGGLLSYLKGSCALVRTAYPHVERQHVDDHCLREVVISNSEIQYVAYVAGRDYAPDGNKSIFAFWS